MPVSSHLADELGERLGFLAATAAGQDRAVLLSVTLRAGPARPVDLFAAATGERFLWHQPSEGFALVGVGVAARTGGGFRGGAGQAAARWRGLQGRCVADGAPSCPLAAPVAAGGFAFDPSRDPDGLWAGLAPGLVVPQFVYIRSGESSWLNANAVLAPGSDAGAVAAAAVADLGRWLAAAGGSSDSGLAAGITSASDEPGASEWRSAVRAVLGAIESGEVEKVVLARRLQVRSGGPILVPALLRRLEQGYPQCTVFAYAQGDTCFLGATPERLVRVRGLEVAADPLAGSAPRGETKAEDKQWADALLSDEKERREHSLVVRAYAQALAPICSALDVPESPSVLRVSNVQHLHSPVRGVLASGHDVLDLVARLHPTPATGGWPVDRALDIIRRYEPFGRGWYAGPIGWVDARGDGEFAVGIRSALVRGTGASLYAGCGIVSGSDPEREYAESGLKLRAMLWAMGGEAE